jgi:hypothetical protein
MTSVPATDVQMHHIDPNDPRMQAIAARLVDGIIKHVELSGAVSVFLVAAELIFGHILHRTTPMPELNIMQVERLLDTLKANVMAHASCAQKINGVPTAQSKVVH